MRAGAAPTALRVTRLQTALAAAAAMLLCAAPAVSADVARSAPAHVAGPVASAASSAGRKAPPPWLARQTRATRVQGARTGRKTNCRTKAKRTDVRTVRSRRLRTVSGADRTSSSSRAAALQAATIAQVLATPCQNIDLTPNDGKPAARSRRRPVPDQHRAGTAWRGPAAERQQARSGRRKPRQGNDRGQLLRPHLAVWRDARRSCPRRPATSPARKSAT